MPAHDPTKHPSDAKIIKAFNDFESAYVVIEASFNNRPNAFVSRKGLDRALEAHDTFRKAATIAQANLDEKAQIRNAKKEAA